MTKSKMHAHETKVSEWHICNFYEGWMGMIVNDVFEMPQTNSKTIDNNPVISAEAIPPETPYFKPITQTPANQAPKRVDFNPNSVIALYFELG